MGKAKIKLIYTQLDELFDSSDKLDCTGDNKFVIFSDLHMGDGSAKDDFRQNSELFKTAIEGYYFKKKYQLILNGDVEELQRFSLKKIFKKWEDVYSIFDRFHEDLRLYKLIGNHDLALCLPKWPSKYKIHHGITLNTKAGDILIFHGHQASMANKRLNKLVGYTLRYLANPLRIRNYSVAHDSRKQYAIERRVYHHSSFRKRVSIIGHTHRPLFESLTKAERLKYKIEQLCRKYARSQSDLKKKPIKKLIKSHKKELQKIFSKGKRKSIDSNLYHSIFHIPCLFNSGCVIGKRGMTCLEIDKNEIALVHWFDKKISRKYLDKKGYEPEQFEDTDYFRMVLNIENLKYIFSRINLLS